MARVYACRSKCRPEVEQAAWQLVWLSRDLADDAMAAFTGKLLALVGPLDEHHIAFTRSPAYTQTSGTLSREVPFSRSIPTRMDHSSSYKRAFEATMCPQSG